MAVLTLRPNADSAVALTKSAGADNYALVDEVGLDTADYVTSVGLADGVWTEDIYGFPNHTTESGVISSVIVKGYFTGYINTTPTNHLDYIKLLVKMGGTRYYSGTLDLTANPTLLSYTWTTNPNTSAAWTWTNIDDLLAGKALYSTIFKTDNFGVRGFQTWVEVNYTVAGWANIAKKKGVAAASIAKCKGVAVANIAKLKGMAV